MGLELSFPDRFRKLESLNRGADNPGFVLLMEFFDIKKVK